ncbi:MAG: 50S ribosomal protein L23 [Candidatus Spechtbacterales bacterium]
MPILTDILKKAGMKEPEKQKRVREDRREKKQALDQRDQQKQQDKITALSKSSGQAKKTGGSTLKQASAHGAHNVLVRPHISEKSVAMNEHGRYVFEVRPGVNAYRVAEAITTTYGVEVAKVNMIKAHPKKSRTRFARFGTRPRYNKAVVTLKTGNAIEVLPQ